MSRWIPLSVFVFFLTLGVSSIAHAQTGPDGRTGYVIVHGDLMRALGGAGIDGPIGGSVEWGSFQNKYIGAGTKIGLFGAGSKTGMPRQLFFGGGPQFHIPIGQHILLIPAFNLGYLLQDSAGGFGGTIAVFASLGAAYKYHQFYFGMQAERPIYLPLPNENSDFFPPLTTLGAFFGLYY